MVERVLITGARAAVAIDLARDFHRAGYEVHLADSTTARIARWSRAPAAVHRYAPPRTEPARFAAGIAALDAALIVPTCEEVFHLARLPLGGRLFAPPLPLLRRLHAKHEFAALASGLGLPVPETRLLTPDFAEDSRAWVFKPAYSRFGARALIGPASLDGLDPDGLWVAQRRVVGREISFYAVAHQGALAAFAAYASSWRLSGGASFAFAPLEAPLAGRIAEVAAALAAGTGLTGQFACDLIVDEAGDPWLIECNPRATSGLHMLTCTGALARAIVSGGDRLSATGGPRHMLPAMLTYGLRQALAERRFGEWRQALRAGTDVIGAPGDRRPALGAVLDTLGFMAAARRAGISVTEATTADIEWNGEEEP